MANPKPRSRPTHCGPVFGGVPPGHWSTGPPRSPEVQDRKTHPDGSISLTLHLSPDVPRPQLDKAVAKILTWVLYKPPSLKQRHAAERKAVVKAWVQGADRRRSRSRSYISQKTGIPEHRVKLILRDWRVFRNRWESPAGLRRLQRIKRDCSRGKNTERHFLGKGYRLLRFIQDGRCNLS